jgi:hypothetical protein
MQCISATQFDEKYMPLDGVKTGNCEIHSTSLIKIL